MLTGSAWAAEAPRTSGLSLSPLTGPNNEAGDVVVVLKNPGQTVGLQVDVEPVAGRFEITACEPGAASSNLRVRSAPLANGQTRVVLYSPANTRLTEGEVIRIRGVRRNAGTGPEAGLSLRAATIADERGLSRDFAFTPYISLGKRGGGATATPGQPVIFDGLVFPVDPAAGGVEVRVNGQMITQTPEGRFSVTWTPLEPGLAFVTAMTRSGGAAAVPLTLTVEGAPLDSYTKWRSFYFPSDPSSPTGPGQPLGDADRDSVLNIWEYLRGSSPNIPDALPLVENTVVVSGAESFLGLKVRVRATATDLEVVGEASASLQFPAAGTTPALVVSREEAGEFQIVTLRDTVPVSGSARRFLRARVRPVAP